MKKYIFPLLLISPLTSASGLLLQEATMANAGTAGAGDGVYTKSAAANWTNPATMSQMGEQKTTVNAMALGLEMEYADNNDPAGNSTAKTFMPTIGVFHVQQLTKDIHLGLNFGIVGGSSVEYGNDWAGAALLDSALMSALQINPALSYKINDKLSIAAGAQINYGLIKVSTSVLETDIATDWAYGFNVGTLYQEKQWSLGMSYRSKLDHKFDVDVETLSLIKPNPSQLNLTTSILVPAITDISARFAINERLSLLGSVQFHQWSEFEGTPINNEIKDLSIERDWDDVWHYAIGTEYALNNGWTLKAGFSYETSPQDDPTKQWVDLPAGEQYRYALGASTLWGNRTVDVFYEYADLGSVDMTRAGVQGQFIGHIHFVGANMTF
ncbi:MAG: outer membrane protein transport protein [Moritella sp.]|uniref:OmpP1/FadL family transporter n=1 Tax=Moritella sp. TaxID=78556 RepID=UPI0029AA7350|nr:outer membrane protein transport protein [Moritella sp.]MDX2321548.1 outer membrane protein transport protein [Moritella sp.]